jgi:hypothetical protein
MTDTDGMPNSGEVEALHGGTGDVASASLNEGDFDCVPLWRVSEVRPALLRSRKFLNVAEPFPNCIGMDQVRCRIELAKEVKRLRDQVRSCSTQQELVEGYRNGYVRMSFDCQLRRYISRSYIFTTKPPLRCSTNDRCPGNRRSQ